MRYKAVLPEKANVKLERLARTVTAQSGQRQKTPRRAFAMRNLLYCIYIIKCEERDTRGTL